MTDTTEKTAFISGGTGTAAHGSAAEAYKSVPAGLRRRAFIMLGSAGATTVFLLLSRLLGLAERGLSAVLTGVDLSPIIHYVILAVLAAGFVTGLTLFLRARCGFFLFAVRRDELSYPRVIGAIAVGAAAVFIASAVLGSKLKLQLEMGMGISMSAALVNLCVYFYYAIRIFLGMIAATLVQNAMSTLFPARYTLPYGSIYLVAVFGVLELAFEAFTTAHAFPLCYFFFTYAYAAIYALSARRLHASYWAAFVVMVL